MTFKLWPKKQRDIFIFFLGHKSWDIVVLFQILLSIKNLKSSPHKYRSEQVEYDTIMDGYMYVGLHSGCLSRSRSMRHLTSALGVMNMKQLSVYEPHNDAIYEVILPLSFACSRHRPLFLPLCVSLPLSVTKCADNI